MYHPCSYPSFLALPISSETNARQPCHVVLATPGPPARPKQIGPAHGKGTHSKYSWHMALSPPFRLRHFMLLDAASWHGSSHLLLLLLEDDNGANISFDASTGWGLKTFGVE